MLGGKGVIFSVGAAGAAIVGTWNYLQSNNPELVEQMKSKEGAKQAITSMYLPKAISDAAEGTTKPAAAAPEVSKEVAKEAAIKAVSEKYAGKVLNVANDRLKNMSRIAGVDIASATNDATSKQPDNPAATKSGAEDDLLKQRVRELEAENSLLKSKFRELEEKYTASLVTEKEGRSVIPATDTENALRKELNEYKTRYFDLLRKCKGVEDDLVKSRRDFEEAFSAAVDAAARANPATGKQALYFREKCKKLEDDHKQIVNHYQVLINELKAEIEQLKAAPTKKP